MTNKTSTEDIFRELEQKANEYLEISGNCAQSSFLALQEQFGLDGGPILKALTPFPGLAFRGEVCGTVVGCTMALGLVFGRERLDDWGGYIHSIPPVRAFFRHFKKEVGSIVCGDIVKSEFGERFDLVEPTETKRWLKAGALEKCAAVLGKGVRIAAEIILESAQPTRKQ
ncbi:MAG: C-GCAxxG-C-C family protein [Desulfobacteraceae bacterium]|jgi:C_GCAxxG_C_C family probable redox protein